MAKYCFYNGTELPAPPEWDKEVYPYAAVLHSNLVSLYYFVVAVEPIIYNGSNKLGYTSPSSCIKYEVTNAEAKTGEWSNETATEGETTVTYASCIWSNHDIYKEDGTLNKAASEIMIVPDPTATTPVETEEATATYQRKGGVWLKRDFYKRVNDQWVKQKAYARRNGEWLPKSEEVVVTNCLTFYSAEAFNIANVYGTKNWDGTLYYSTDGVTWIEWDGFAVIASAWHGGEQRIYMRGVGNSVITGNASRQWLLNGENIHCVGSIENILDYETVASGGHPTMGEKCFYNLFYQNASLVTAPELPATTLSPHCYSGLFWGCTNLVTPPDLPATTLETYCYYYMFAGCSSLKTAPELPATTLASDCYESMFNSCTSLVTAPELPATTLANYCYTAMFSGCTSLIAAPALPATTLTMYCYRYMFRDCTSLVTAPSLPATTLKSYCYQYMFENCISLSTLPLLPALTMPTYCYQYMFIGCTNIKLSETQTDEYHTEYRMPTSGTGTASTSSLGKSMTNMFKGTGGTFTGTPTVNTTYYTSNAVV